MSTSYPAETHHAAHVSTTPTSIPIFHGPSSVGPMRVMPQLSLLYQEKAIRAPIHRGARASKSLSTSVSRSPPAEPSAPTASTNEARVEEDREGRGHTEGVMCCVPAGVSGYALERVAGVVRCTPCAVQWPWLGSYWTRRALGFGTCTSMAQTWLKKEEHTCLAPPAESTVRIWVHTVRLARQEGTSSPATTQLPLTCT